MSGNGGVKIGNNVLRPKETRELVAALKAQVADLGEQLDRARRERDEAVNQFTESQRQLRAAEQDRDRAQLEVHYLKKGGRSHAGPDGKTIHTLDLGTGFIIDRSVLLPSAAPPPPPATSTDELDEALRRAFEVEQVEDAQQEAWLAQRTCITCGSSAPHPTAACASFEPVAAVAAGARGISGGIE